VKALKVLSLFVAVALFAAPLFSQTQLASALAACGESTVSMAVNLDDKQHALAQPETGKALIYFIQDIGQAGTLAYPTTKIGIDGKWVGANKKNSWFAVAVDPGEHHLCAEIQSSFVAPEAELAHLTAEAGKVYYFRTRIIFAERTAEYFSLAPVDSDEANFQIAAYPQATAKARKKPIWNEKP
jgi:Protein of unknown function (DUF2846)